MGGGRAEVRKLVPPSPHFFQYSKENRKVDNQFPMCNPPPKKKILSSSLEYFSITWRCRLDYAHGLRKPNEAFFHRNPKLFGLSRQFGQINFVVFGVFSANLSAPILILRVPCPCFPLFNNYFYKKLSLYIQIPNIYLGLGFEFGPQLGIQPSCVRSPWLWLCFSVLFA